MPAITKERLQQIFEYANSPGNDDWDFEHVAFYDLLAEVERLRAEKVWKSIADEQPEVGTLIGIADTYNKTVYAWEVTPVRLEYWKSEKAFYIPLPPLPLQS